MELPQSIKQEKVDCYGTAIEPDVKLEPNLLNSMEIKLEPVKIEPHSYVTEPNNLFQKLNLTKEIKIIGNNSKSMFDCSLNEMSEENGSEIKLEISEEMEEIEKTEDIVDVKWKIENEELNIKEDINIEDNEQRASNFKSKQYKYKTTQKKYLKSNPEQNKISMTMIKCDFCDFKTIYKIRFNRHIAEHNRSYKCDHCDYMNNKKNLHRHVLKHRNSDKFKIYKCDQCDFQTVRRYYLKQHSLKHKNFDEVITYKCYHCDYHTIYKEYIRRHMITHQNPDKVNLDKCNQCDYKTACKRYLKTHSLIHKNSDEVNMYKCDHCEFQTVHKGYLKKHGLKHKNFDEVDKYKCDQCNYQTVYKRYLTKHSLKHKNVEEVDMYKCDQCDYQTVRKEYLKRHHVLKHSDEVGVKKYKKSKRYLKTQSLIHKNSDEVNMYKCDHCEFQTVHKGYLKKHGLKHTNFDEVDRYKCDQCDYQTVNKRYLTKHSLKHKNVEELICINVTNVITKQSVNSV